MNYKDTKPLCWLFFKIDLLTEIAALCLTDLWTIIPLTFSLVHLHHSSPLP